jgi:hypothetical protein
MPSLRGRRLFASRPVVKSWRYVSKRSKGLPLAVVLPTALRVPS